MRRASSAARSARRGARGDDRAVADAADEPIGRCRAARRGRGLALRQLDVDEWRSAPRDRAARASRRARTARRRRCSTPAAAPATFPTRSACARRADHRLAPPRQRHRRPVAGGRACGAPTSMPTSSTATSSTGRRGAACRPGRRRPRVSRGCRGSACPRARPSASRACSTSSRRACRRSTSSSTISSCAASASAGSRSRRRTAPPAVATRCANGSSPSST